LAFVVHAACYREYPATRYHAPAMERLPSFRRPRSHLVVQAQARRITLPTTDNASHREAWQHGTKDLSTPFFPSDA